MDCRWRELLADLKRARISEGKRDKLFSLGFDFQESDVIALVGPDEFCRVVGLVAKNDFDGLRSFDDVKIRENVAARVNHETGAGAFDGDGVHKEIIFGGFGKNICDRRRSLAINAHVDGFVVGENGIALRYRSCRIRAAERQCFDFGRSVRTVSRTGPIRAKN